MPDKKLTWDDLEFDDKFENFVGRADKITAFKDNFLGDRPKWMVLSITGEGGVGKSTLLKQYIRLGKAKKIMANLVLCDDHQMTPVDVMGSVAEELTKLKITNREFNDRYAKYRQAREEAEKDPNAPRGLVDLGAHVVTDIALDGISRVPGLGSTGSDSFKKAAGDAISEAAQYSFSRWSNKDEVQLLREPEKTLTPLFVNLLNEAATDKRLVVMLDVFERTGKFLSPWLINLFMGQYGKISAWVSFILSGRDQLDQHWTELGKKLVRLVLEHFELNETREYLINRNITDLTLIEQIHKDTGGLPVLVELLAATNPKPGQPLPDISKDAVDRFLQWTPVENRSTALIAAVPHQFNQDILAALFGENTSDMFEWLSEQSYTRSDTERGWFYHEKVRELMLHYQQNLSPGELEKRHTILSVYFSELQAKMDLPLRDAYQSKSWRRYETERVYHLFSSAPEKHWSQVMLAFLPAFHYRPHFAAKLAGLAQQVIDELKFKTLNQEIANLAGFVSSYDKYEYPEMIKFINSQEKIASQNKNSLLAFFVIRGGFYRNMLEYRKALTDFTCAIELNEKDIWTITRRGEAYRVMGRYDEALTDFNRAIELNEKDADTITGRAETYCEMGRYDDALNDFTRAIELSDNNAWMITKRAEVYRQMGKYDEALKDYNDSIELEPTSYSYFRRGQTYHWMEMFKEALINYDLALELEEDFHWAHEQKGIVLSSLERYNEAIDSFTQASITAPTCASCIEQRGVTYQKMGNYDEALKDFDYAIELDKESAWAIARRGETYRQLDRYDDALKDFNRAVELNKKDTWAIAERGETYRQMHRYEDALKDFNRAIKLNKKDTWAITKRGETYRQMDKFEDALKDFNRAIELDSNYHWAYEQKGWLLLSLKRFDEAIIASTQAHNTDNICTTCILLRGEIYRQMGKYEEALSVFTMTIQEDLPDAYKFSCRAFVFGALGDKVSAQKDLEQALSLECKKPFDHYGRGLALVLSNRILESLLEFELAFIDVELRTHALTFDLLDPICDLPEFKALLAKYE